MYGLAGHHGAPGRPDLERVVRVPRPLGLEDLLVARREQALEQPRLGVDDVDPGAVAVEQAEGLVDRELDHRLGVPSARDAGAELAQRPLDHRLALAGLARAVELGDEPGVGHRERGVLGERADERDLGRGERVRAARERAQRPEDLRPGDQGRDDERPQPDLVDEAVRALRVAERAIRDVVRRDDHPALGHGLAEHPAADRQLELADPVAGRRVGDAGGVDELEEPGVGVQQVDERAVGVEQPGRLLRRPVEEAVALALGVGARRGRRRQGVGGLDHGGGARAVGARGAASLRGGGLADAPSTRRSTRPPASASGLLGCRLGGRRGRLGRDLVATTGRV